MNKWSLVVVLLGLYSCVVTASQSELKASEKLVYQIEPGRSMNPYYTFQLLGEGSCQLQAKRNFKLQGNYTAQLSQDQLREIDSVFKQNNFIGLDSVYQARVLGMPTRSVQLRLEDGSYKRVVDKFKAPASLKRIEKYLESLIENLNWKK